MAIVLPPVQTNLLRLVDRTDHQSDPDGQEFDFGERHLDIAGDDQPFVEHAVENVDQPGITALVAGGEVSRHEMESMSPVRRMCPQYRSPPAARSTRYVSAGVRFALTSSALRVAPRPAGAPCLRGIA